MSWLVVLHLCGLKWLLEWLETGKQHLKLTSRVYKGSSWYKLINGALASFKIVSGIARGCSGGWSTPSDLDTRLVLMYNYWLILTYLGKDIVCTVACKQIEIQSSNIGGVVMIWGMRKSNYYSYSCSRVRTELWAMFLSLKWKLQVPRWSATFKGSLQSLDWNKQKWGQRGQLQYMDQAKR